MIQTGCPAYIINYDESVGCVNARFKRTASFKPQSFASSPDFLRNRLQVKDAVVICDLRMSEKGGIMVYDLLSSSSNSLPFIFLTAALVIRGDDINQRISIASLKSVQCSSLNTAGNNYNTLRAVGASDRLANLETFVSPIRN